MRTVTIGFYLKKMFHPALKFLALGVTIWMMAGQSVYADIYMYIDSDGVLHFTNRPTSSNYKVYVKERPNKSTPSVNTNEYDAVIQAAADRHGVSFSLIKAIIRAESGFNPKAVSHKGAMGLMQIMPDNFKAFNLQDPFDPEENIMAGARYVARLLDRFQGRLPLALAAYNAGPNRVEVYQDIPPFAETEQYVKRVMKYYYAYN